MRSGTMLQRRLGERVRQARAAFDARAPRERLLVAAAVLVMLVGLVDALWISSALRAWKQARLQNEQVSAALSAAKAELARRTADAQDSAGRLNQAIGETRGRLAALDRDLSEQASGLVGADRMVAVLEQILAEQPQVKVLAMRSLPRSQLATALPRPQAAAAAPASAASVPGAATPHRSAAGMLYRHGVEITLEGRFADLVAYLRALDAHPQKLLPGGLRFQVREHPLGTLTMQLFTVSLDKHWLEI